MTDLDQAIRARLVAAYENDPRNFGHAWRYLDAHPIYYRSRPRAGAHARSSIGSAAYSPRPTPSTPTSMRRGGAEPDHDRPRPDHRLVRDPRRDAARAGLALLARTETTMTDTLDFQDFADAHFPDRRVIQCNLTRGQSSAAAGARAYVVLTNPGGGHDRIAVLIRSRGGRWIEKWQDIRTLENFRVKTIPFGHPMYSSRADLGVFDPEATAARLNEAHAREVARSLRD